MVKSDSLSFIRVDAIKLLVTCLVTTCSYQLWNDFSFEGINLGFFLKNSLNYSEFLTSGKKFTADRLFVKDFTSHIVTQKEKKSLQVSLDSESIDFNFEHCILSKTQYGTNWHDYHEITGPKGLEAFGYMYL